MLRRLLAQMRDLFLGPLLLFLMLAMVIVAEWLDEDPMGEVRRD